MPFGPIPLAVFLATASLNVRAEQPPPGLDGKSIHAAYNEGNFETVLARIEAFTRSHPTYSKDDSIFIAKHLAVVYTANPATREKGKHYMFQLLELSPSAKIVDMFVSDEIDRIFERVKEEFAIRQSALGKDALLATPSGSPPASGPGPAAAATPASDRSAAAKPASRSHALYWVMGGTALVAASAVATYFLLFEPHPTPKDTVYDIPH